MRPAIITLGQTRVAEDAGASAAEDVVKATAGDLQDEAEAIAGYKAGFAQRLNEAKDASDFVDQNLTDAANGVKDTLAGLREFRRRKRSQKLLYRFQTLGQ
jgi:hypothetical protein